MDHFDHSFAVPASIDDVWPTLLDLARVAPCLPGAELLGRTGEHSYDVAMKLSMGPMRLRYSGSLEITEIHPDEYRATMVGSAKETRGQGTATATIQMQLSEDGADTRIGLATDLALTGRAAQMGRGLVEQVADVMLGDFASCLAAQLESPTPGSDGTATQSVPAAMRPAAVNPLKLLLRVAVARVRRLFRRST